MRKLNAQCKDLFEVGLLRMALISVTITLFIPVILPAIFKIF